MMVLSLKNKELRLGFVLLVFKPPKTQQNSKENLEDNKTLMLLVPP